jgi:hypothetical protein
MQFTYTRLGAVRLPEEDRDSAPRIWVHSAALRLPGGGEGPVLGLIQENPSIRNVWCAVAAMNGTLPAVDYDTGLWSMPHGRGGFGSKREAAVWLLGVRDAGQSWFNEEN